MHTGIRRTIQSLLFLFISIHFLFAQGRLEFHGIIGMSNYQGDLQPSTFTVENARGAIGANIRYGITEKFFARGGIGVGEIYGNDKKNKPELQVRNLDFKSKINDLYLGLEYRLLKPEVLGLTPYVFVGVGVFHFNPFTTYGDKNEKIFLQPLGTEGQGLPEYPDREMYKLTQLSIPIAGGLLWHVNDHFMLGIEFRQNKTFTDYLDDVSNRYALEAPLLRDRGPIAVELAWRRDEYDGRPYPANEPKRGDPNFNDWYYHFGFSVGFTIPNGAGGAGWGMGGKAGKNRMKQFGCPKWK